MQSALILTHRFDSFLFCAECDAEIVAREMKRLPRNDCFGNLAEDLFQVLPRGRMRDILYVFAIEIPIVRHDFNGTLI